ncbi:MAG: enoyl-CoA hydratase/isomerase family protein [Candidatus Tectomicrobia bacterium]|nr:enoyl-CoA hydratase/isomerase family protein [Candidatus Tectomicrobia bacterium]
MAYEFIRYEKKDHIAYITINRPEVMNALHPPANEELSDAWTDFGRDDDSWVAILTGAGDRAFSAGNDLKYTAAQSAQGGGRTQPRRPIIGGFGGLTNRFDIWKPIIAAVNGYALGGGLETAMACDIIIAAEHAQFGLPEPRRGLVASAGGVQRLPRQIPLKVAMGMILTGKPITAQRAYELGLVNEVVPLKDLIPAAERWAQEIMECAPLSVQASKQASMIGLDLPIEHAINRSYFFYQLLQASDDYLEGPRAFAEKRKPQWKGK